MKKTYEVNHLTELHLEVKADRVTIPVHFLGGAVTPFGMVPATFTTDNEALQYLIEQHPEFKSGRITDRNDSKR